MTDEQIVQAVAEKVMGRKYPDIPDERTCPDCGGASDWDPIRFRADADAVLDKLTESYDAISIVWTLQKTWMVHIWNPKAGKGRAYSGESNSRNRAICITALKGFGVEA